jgi:hypothetical protein
VNATPAVEILEQAKKLGITLRADGKNIRFHPRDAMTRELADFIGGWRGDLLKLLAAAAPPPKTTCWNCRGTRFFARPERLTWVCAHCHPPGDPSAMVWHEVSAEVRDA